MELLDPKRSMVLVIDLQGKLMDMVGPSPARHRGHQAPDASSRTSSGFPVVMTEQYPKGIGPTHPEVRAVYDGLVTPKFFMEKTAFGCCGDAQFEALLQRALPGFAPRERQMVVAGIEAHVCVMQTVVATPRDRPPGPSLLGMRQRARRGVPATRAGAHGRRRGRRPHQPRVGGLRVGARQEPPAVQGPLHPPEGRPAHGLSLVQVYPPCRTRSNAPSSTTPRTAAGGGYGVRSWRWVRLLPSPSAWRRSVS